MKNSIFPLILIAGLVAFILFTGFAISEQINIWYNRGDGTIVLLDPENNVVIGANESTDYKLFVNGSTFINDSITVNGYLWGANLTNYTSPEIFIDNGKLYTNATVGGLNDWTDGDPFFNVSDSYDFSWELFSNFNSTTYAPYEVGVEYDDGISGNLASIVTGWDNDAYNITEQNNGENFIIYINFSGIDNFNFINMRTWYDTSSDEKDRGHHIHVGLWDWDASEWEEEYESIYSQHAYITVVRSVFDANSHIGTGGDLGEVRLRLRHDEEPDEKTRGSHIMRVEYAALVKGFNTLVGTSHNSLGGRNDIWGHEWAMDTRGLKNFTENITFEENISIINDDFSYSWNYYVNSTGCMIWEMRTND